LLYSVETGESARKLLLGSEGFAHLDADPEAAAIFHRALAELGRVTSRTIVEACALSGGERVMDVGGGSGELLAALLRAHPAATGVLFDVPGAIRFARGRFEATGLVGRCEFVSGDFFESVPAGADVYILKSVLHDWDDERCASILANCRQAMGSHARLLLVEEMLPDRLDTSATHQAIARSDLNMLIAHAAGERTERELRALLGSVGLEVGRVVPGGLTFSVLEGMPAQGLAST
jgi:hypothetical protein